MPSNTQNKPERDADGTRIVYSAEEAEVFEAFGTPYVAHFGAAYEASQAVMAQASEEKRRAEEAARIAALGSVHGGVNLAGIACDAERAADWKRYTEQKAFEANMAPIEAERAFFATRLDRLAVAKRHLDASNAAPLFSEERETARTAANVILDELAASAPDVA